MAPRTDRPLGVGVIGLGYMGQTHLKAYRSAERAGAGCRIVAVADQDPARRKGDFSVRGSIFKPNDEPLFDPESTRSYDSALDLLEDPAVDLVSICTHTDTHVDLAIAALEAKKHVLVEKPVAVASRDVERLVERARSSDRLIMPAMCMRFWPAWEWLADRVRERTFGAVRSATFRRLGTRPGWGGGFYQDLARSGGALVDLHIHDADFVLHLFGAPDAVDAAGDLEHVTAIYRYRRGPRHVVAEGGWDHSPGFPFAMRYTVVFETATADFDMARPAQLLLCRDGSAEPVDVPTHDGYDGEVRHLLKAIRTGDRALRATLDDALLLARLLERERQALGGG
jgi:predicted dehydrogenase